MILLKSIMALLLGTIPVLNGGTITPDNDRTVVLEKEKNESFSWTFAPGADEIIVGVSLYNGTENDENKLWSVLAGAILPKGEEMFNERLKVNYGDDGDDKKLTVTIENAKLNDSVTILLKGTFLNNKDVTLSKRFTSSVTIDVQGGPELYKQLNSNYNFSYNTNPSIKLVVLGKQEPSVQFTFDVKTAQAERVPLENEFKQYEFDLKLPPLKGRHCGTILSYKATSTLQNSSPITGRTTIYVNDFPLDVTIDSFSYDENIPTVIWKLVESGSCIVKYDLIVANQTTSITKESIEGISLQITEIVDPLYVQITAVHGSRRRSSTALYTVTPKEQDEKKIILSVAAAFVGGTFFGIMILLIISWLKARMQKRETNNENSKGIDETSSENYASLNLNQTTKQPGQYMHLQNLKKEETNYEIPDSPGNLPRAEYEVMPDDN